MDTTKNNSAKGLLTSLQIHVSEASPTWFNPVTRPLEQQRLFCYNSKALAMEAASFCGEKWSSSHFIVIQLSGALVSSSVKRDNHSTSFHVVALNETMSAKHLTICVCSNNYYLFDWSKIFSRETPLTLLSIEVALRCNYSSV